MILSISVFCTAVVAARADSASEQRLEPGKQLAMARNSTIQTDTPERPWRELKMAIKFRYALLHLAAMVTVLATVASLPLAAAGPPGNPENPAPAGQMCPKGSYVIGFDAENNILCTEACGNGVLNTGEACDDGNTDSGDGCSATCQSVSAEAAVEVISDSGDDPEEVIAQTEPEDPAALTSITVPVISDVDPSWLVFGKSETVITVSGTGFHAESVIIFEGSTYEPSVNREGTRLETTIPTEDLSIGTYALTVSNGSGRDSTLKKALVVY